MTDRNDGSEDVTRTGRHAMPDFSTPEPTDGPNIRPRPSGQGSNVQHSNVQRSVPARPADSHGPESWVEPSRTGGASLSKSPSAQAPATTAGQSAVAVAPVRPANASAPARTSGGRSSERRLAFWMVAPAALLMAVVTGYPIIYAFWLSLNKASLSAPGESSFVWFDNYATVLTDSYWWNALGITLFITVVSVAIELVLGMAIALVMHRTIFGKGTIRTLVLIPYGIVTVAAAFSWYYAWTPDTGYLANLLPDGSAPLTHQWQSLAVIILAEVWKTTPFMALLLLAGLALVPDDLLKAAEVDGAGAWTRLWRIIIPLMKPAILVALLFRTLDAFRIFDNIYVLTHGSNNTESVSILGYDNLFKAFNLGIGSAISVLIFVCVAIIAAVFVIGFGTAAPGSDAEGK